MPRPSINRKIIDTNTFVLIVTHGIRVSASSFPNQMENIFAFSSWLQPHSKNTSNVVTIDGKSSSLISDGHLYSVRWLSMPQSNSQIQKSALNIYVEMKSEQQHLV